MAYNLTGIVKERVFGSVSRKAVALVLADYCDANYSCFVGQKRLADESEVGERTVRRILKDFEMDGLVRRERRFNDKGHRTSDRMLMSIKAIKSLPATMSSRELDLPATEDSLPATGDIPTGHSLAGEPPVEPSEEEEGYFCRIESTPETYMDGSWKK